MTSERVQKIKYDKYEYYCACSPLFRFDVRLKAFFGFGFFVLLVNFKRQTAPQIKQVINNSRRRESERMHDINPTINFPTRRKVKRSIISFDA